MSHTSRFGALKKLSDEASQGEWGLFDDRGTLEIGHAEHLGHRPNIVAWGGFDSCDKPMPERRANAKFIVALVNAYREGLLTPASENSPQLPLPKVIGPVTEMVQEIAGLCGSMEGTESNCEVVACVLNAAKRYIGGERAE